ncbi:MAG: YraN family protein [Bacteroidia bacterium]|nr:YraN family protein [Bacteroidia bacterium]
MALHNSLGNEGENTALQFLKNKGYQIIATNYRYLKAEIDIIAQWKQQLIFIEVKTRSSSVFGMPQDAVGIKKQKLMIEAAHNYILQNQLRNEARFDVVAIIKTKSGTEIIHVEDAFYPQAE